MNLARSIQDYLAVVAQRSSAGTAMAYRDRLAQFSLFHEANPSRTITRHYVAQYLKTLTERGVARRTVHAYQSALHVFFAWCMEERRARSNPVAKFRGAVRAAAVEPITADQYRAIKQQAEAQGLFEWRDACVIGWHTGLRLSDVVQLEWKSVGETITVEPQKTEAYGKVVRIPLSEEMANTLEERRIASGAGPEVLPALAQLYRVDRHKTLSVQFIRLARKAGVDAGFHAFRHAFVSRLLSRGVASAVVASMTGHTLSSMNRYSHISVEAAAEAIRVAL